MRGIRLNMSKRHMLEGYVFVLPFILGTLAFFIFPLYVSIKLSFGKVIKMEGFKIVWKGTENYLHAFLVDTAFVPMFIRVVKQTLLQAPLIIVFSLLIAMLINRKIKCRGLFRTIFFIPFLLGMGDVMQQLLNQGVDKQVISLADGTLLPRGILAYLGTNVVTAIDNYFGIIVFVLWNSGVQILLFLSGLQSISSSLYESAQIDGATEWEMFWKITLPMVSPIMLLNIVYTLIESFTSITNPILEYIQTQAFKQMKFEFSAAMGWVYFAFILLLALIVIGIMNRFLHASDMKGQVGKKRNNNKVASRKEW